MNERFTSESELDTQDKAEIKNYTRSPNMLIFGYREISPQEKWLYICLKHLCGKKGTRYLSLRYISEQTGISVGALSTSKNKQGAINEGMIRHLYDAGLIHSEIKKHNGKGNPVYHITITDIWGLNQAFFTRSEIGQDEDEDFQPVRNSDKPVHNSDKIARNSDKPVQISDEPVRKPLQYQDYIQDYKQDDNNTREQEESIAARIDTPTIASALSLDARSQSENDNHSYSPSDSTTPEPAPSESERGSARLQETANSPTFQEQAAGIAAMRERGDEQEQQENLRVLQEAGIVPFETPQGEPHASTIPGSTHRDTSGLSSGTLPGVSRVDDSTTPDTTLEVAHEDILQVLRPSGLPDDNDAHGTNGRDPLDSHGTAGAADALAVPGAQRGNAQRGVASTSQEGARATGEGCATDGRLDEQGDDNATNIRTDRAPLLHPGDTCGDTGRPLAEQTITQQTSSLPPTVELRAELGNSAPAPVPSVVPSHDCGTALSTHSPVSPLTTSTVVQAGALPASSFPLSPTNGQGTTFLADMDSESAQQGDEKPKTPAPLSEPDMSGKWSNERLVQYAEWCNDKRYTDKMREEQLKAAQAIHKNDKDLTLEQFKQAYDERNDEWWQEHKKKLHVSDMKAKGKSGIDRVHEMLQHIEDRATRNRSKANLRLVPKAEINQPTTNIRELVRQQEAARAAQVQ